MPDFLLELFCEEIPARMQARAADDLARLMGEALAAERLAPTGAVTHVTPRRLVFAAHGLPAAQPDLEEERKGPREGAPQAALDGFLKSTGLTLDQCQLRDTPKGKSWFAVLKRPGRPAPDMLAAIVARVLADFPWPKSMRWAETTFRWVRPLHHVLALFDGRPLPGGFHPDAGLDLPFVAETRGHRFLAPGPVAVTGFADYCERLAAAQVVLDRQQRKAAILDGAATLAGSEGLALVEDDGLAEEVTGLVEWPVVLMGRIDEAFMALPQEVLTTSMRTHQKYFACRKPDGALAPRFIVVANTVTGDGGAAVVAGNERVLRARLSDAQFFWDQDRRTPLEDRLPALADIIFHARLGSMAGKVARLETLAAALAARIPGADAGAAARAAKLAKADLVSGMVGEFPELQGIMGRYYAAGQGEDTQVAQAIAEHYAPLGPSDRCPTAAVSVAVALADKIDTLVGFFAIDERPTGSRDPFALRRAALGVIRLIVENGVRLPLRGVFADAVRSYAGTVEADGAVVGEGLLAFFADRLKVSLREQGVRHDLIDAVFALGNEDDLVRLLARVEALGRLLGSEDGANLLTGYRRAANIVRIEARKDGAERYGAADPARFAQDEERALADALATAGREVGARVAAEDFVGAMAALADLRAPIDAFFDRVTVNADDPGQRRNRLALLQAITDTMNNVADFSKVEG